MDILNSVPVRVNGAELIPGLLAEVRERIARRAHENFIERDSVHGRDLDDWLDAERELIIKLTPVVSAEGEDVFVEVILPDIDFPNLAVHVAPHQMVMSSDPDEDGLRLFQVIDLPFDICLDSVDAEKLQNMIRVTASSARKNLKAMLQNC